MLSIEECRKLIGKPAEHWKDAEIERMRNILYRLAELLVRDFMKEESAKVNV